MFGKINLLNLIKKHRFSVLIGSIVTFIIGVLSIISPFAFGAILVWIIIGLVGVGGILAIVKFIVPGKGNTREGLSLACGILLILVVITLILIGVLGKSVIFEGETYTSMEALTIRILGFCSLFFGAFSVIENIFLLCNVAHIEASERGIVIGKSILGFIIGVLMLVFPFFMLGLNILIGGVYLMFLSITGFIMSIKFWKSGKNNEQYKL